MERRDFAKALALLPAIFGINEIATKETPQPEKVDDMWSVDGIYIFGNNIKTVHFTSKLEGNSYTIVQDKLGNRYRIEKIR